MNFSFTTEISERGNFKKVCVRSQVKNDDHKNIRLSVDNEITVFIPNSPFLEYFDIESWRPFFNTIEKEYSVRYNQHFKNWRQAKITQEIRNRKFYEQPWIYNGGKDLYCRYLNNDCNVARLLEFGWKIKNERIVPPASFSCFAKKFICGFFKQKLEPASFTVPSVIFKSTEKENEFLIVRLFDTAPNPNFWRPCSSLDGEIDLPLQVYALAMHLRRPPLNPLMFDHDLAHMIDNYNYPKYMNANIRLFEKLLEGEIFISPDYTNVNEFKLMLRIGIIHEELVIPNISKADQILAMLSKIGEVFAKGTSKGNFCEGAFANVESNKNRLRKNPNLFEEASYIVNEIPKVLIRHGGGMNDSYNLHHELFVRSTPQQRIAGYIASEKFPLFFRIENREMFSQFAIESILGMLSDCEFILNQSTQGDLEKELLIDRLARLEVALWTAIHFNITGDRIVLDSFQNLKNSLTRKWYESFAIEGSITHLAFVSDCQNSDHIECILDDLN